MIKSLDPVALPATVGVCIHTIKGILTFRVFRRGTIAAQCAAGQKLLPSPLSPAEAFSAGGAGGGSGRTAYKSKNT